MQVVSIDNSEHYTWGAGADGWHLVQAQELSIIQERLPSGGMERRHLHERSRQFFYILEGEAVIYAGDSRFELKPGQGLEIPPGMAHQFLNESDAEVLFLVVSVPPSHQDRQNLDP